MASICPNLTSYKNLVIVLLSQAHGGCFHWHMAAAFIGAWQLLSLVISWALPYVKNEARPGSHTYHFASDRYLCSNDTPKHEVNSEPQI